MKVQITPQTRTQKFFIQKPIVRRCRRRKTQRRSSAKPLRRCSFCRTGHLADGTVAFVGVTACPNCLRDDSTLGFRELLELQAVAHHQKFAGGIV